MQIAHGLGRIALLYVAGVCLLSCLPQHLLKYQGFSESGDQQIAIHLAPADTSDATAKGAVGYHFLGNDQQVWDAALRVLMKNYNVAFVDRKLGLITTEWDSFYVHTDIFRNKISVRIRVAPSGRYEVVVYNNCERLQQSSTPSSEKVWLPTIDTMNEGDRIVRNMALLMNQPLPQTARNDHDRSRLTTTNSSLK